MCKKEWDFDKFMVRNIGTKEHPCVQIYVNNVTFDIKDDVNAYGVGVLGPMFKTLNDQLMYEEVRDLIIQTLNDYGQIRFVIRKKLTSKESD